MLKISLLAVGKIKESYWKESLSEYGKRLSPYTKLDIIEVAAEPTGATTTGLQSMRSEAERILARIPEGAFVVALERTGKEISSLDFAQLLKREGEGGRTIVFIIGGAEGLDSAVLALANAKISLSKMTFVHEMARVILLEQIYRAMTIIAGKTYHR